MCLKITIEVEVDRVLRHYTKCETTVVNREPGPDFTVEEMLKMLNIPVGYVGFIVTDNKLLKKHDVLDSSCKIELYGVYDGG
jgi:hypothetical protein